MSDKTVEQKLKDEFVPELEVGGKLVTKDTFEADLENLVVKSKKIDSSYGLDTVKESRVIIRDVRIAITKKGKELREDAVAFQKAVIAKEKELVEIITPEEDRLKAIEDEVKAEELKKERMVLLPERKEKLLTIDGSVEWATDDQLLAMDGMEFSLFYNSCVTQVHERQQAALKAEQDKKDEEERSKAREKELEQAQERGRLQAIEDEKNRKAGEEVAKKQQEEKLAKEKIENDKKLADSIKYQDFLKEMDYKDNGEFVIHDGLIEVRVYKLVGTYTK